MGDQTHRTVDRSANVQSITSINAELTLTFLTLQLSHAFLSRGFDSDDGFVVV